MVVKERGMGPQRKEISSDDKDALSGFLHTLKNDVFMSKRTAGAGVKKELDDMFDNVSNAFSGTTADQIKHNVEKLSIRDKNCIHSVYTIDPVVQMTQMNIVTGESQIRHDINYRDNRLIREIVKLCELPEVKKV